MKIILPLAILFLFTSCSSISDKYCHVDGATSSARFDASKWQAPNPMNHGQYCKEEDDFNDQSFTNIYNDVYQNTLKTQCQNSSIEGLAKRASDKAEYSHKLTLNFGLCEKVGVKEAEIKKVYLKAFAKSFCNPQRFEDLGIRDADFLNEKNHLYLQACSKRQNNNLKRSYDRAYAKQMITTCGPVSMNKLAVEHAKKKTPLTLGLEKVKRCPAKLQANAIASYSLAYNQENARIQQEEYAKKLEQQLAAQRVQNSRREFAFKGERVYSTCKVDDSMATATLKALDSGTSISGRGTFRWEFFDENGAMIDSRQEEHSISIYSYGEGDEVTNYMKPYSAKSCAVNLAKAIY